MFQVVVDTNVLIAALRSQRGASHRLLRLIGDERLNVNLSVPLVFEYEAVAKREVTGMDISADDIDDILDYICAASSHREIFYLWRPILLDPKDDFILELAVESQSDFIITHNVRHFVEAKQFGISVVTPGEFLRRLGEI